MLKKKGENRARRRGRMRDRKEGRFCLLIKITRGVDLLPFSGLTATLFFKRV
jgi:hypothetical protein